MRLSLCINVPIIITHTQRCRFSDDAQIGIDWPIDGEKPLLSEKDSSATITFEEVKQTL